MRAGAGGVRQSTHNPLKLQSENATSLRGMVETEVPEHNPTRRYFPPIERVFGSRKRPPVSGRAAKRFTQRLTAFE